MEKFTTKDFDGRFPNDDTCLEWIKNHRFPNGIYCPECKKVTKHHKVTGRLCYACDYCGHQTFPIAGTIFHKSTTPLRVWFQVIYRMASTRCGISAKQIQRETGVTYKTAWRMFKQTRTLLSEGFPQFTGEVEADETYVGGVRKGTRGRGAEGKTPVVGIVERKGKVVATVTPDVKSKTITPLITNQVALGTMVYTDEFQSYNRVAKLGYRHLTVNHGAKVYVDGTAHTNTIEGFWSTTKRGIDGVYHAVSPKYLQSYFNEYSFRYNHRKDEQPMFQTFLNQIQA
jgi:transposase-like protein